MHSVAVAIILGVVSFLALPDANAQSMRQRIAACFQSGAINPLMMQMCSGVAVSPPDFHSCMNNGPCLGEAPAFLSGLPPVPPGQPFCGAFGFPPCPLPQPCGFPQTIHCPVPFAVPVPVAPACGAMGHRFCNQPLPCGRPGTFPCVPPLIAQPAFRTPPTALTSINVEAAIAFPSTIPGRAPGVELGGIRVARPPIPDDARLRECRDANRESEKGFLGCMLETAMPREYRLTRECLRRHDDTGRALLCSTGRNDLIDEYDRFDEVRECYEDKNRRPFEVAECLGTRVLGPNERYYLGCLTGNNGDVRKAAVCALGKDMNPEAQIAMNCALSTGGEPYSFATCTGGQLLQREVAKCWEHGIATDRGCFGPNNDYRKFLNSLDSTAKRAFGENSVVYQAYNFWHNNVMAPGPTHEAVRAFNTVLNDIRNGPGPNNDVVRFFNSLPQPKIGNVRVCIPWC